VSTIRLGNSRPRSESRTRAPPDGPAVCIDHRGAVPYPQIEMTGTPLTDRLEMLLVAQWLEAGAPEDGNVTFQVLAAAEELGCADGRAGVLEIMSALGTLEDARRLRVEWAPSAGAPALVRLDDALCRDARRAFEPPPL